MDPKKQQAQNLLRMARQLLANDGGLRALGKDLYKGILGKAGHEVANAIMESLKKAYELGVAEKSASVKTADPDDFEVLQDLYGDLSEDAALLGVALRTIADSSIKGPADFAKRALDESAARRRSWAKKFEKLKLPLNLGTGKSAMPKKLDLKAIKKWMNDHVDDYIDDVGEVNSTSLAEEAALVFDAYLDKQDYEIPTEVFDLAADIGIEHEEKRAATRIAEDGPPAAPAGKGSEDFIELIKSQLQIGDRQIKFRNKSTLGGVSYADVTINFINLPTGVGGAGGGAEAENNRMMFHVEGFGKETPHSPPLHGKVRISQEINAITDRSKNMRSKTGTPEQVAKYLADYLNKIVSEVEPKFTHTKV